MPKNHNNNIYQTTAFDQYPPKQRNALIEKRKRIINLRIQSQSHFNYPDTADYFWKQSKIEAKELQQWIKNNPPPTVATHPKQGLLMKLKQSAQVLFQHEYA